MRKKASIVKYKDVDGVKIIFRNKKTVLVGGCFDLIHFGHLKFLEKAKQQGDFLIVALESDEFIKKNKKKVPVHSQSERAEILANFNMVDLVILLPLLKTNNDYQELVKKISPRIIAVTAGDRQLKNKKRQAAEIGSKVIEVMINLKKFSTGNIRKIFNL